MTTNIQHIFDVDEYVKSKLTFGASQGTADHSLQVWVEWDESECPKSDEPLSDYTDDRKIFHGLAKFWGDLARASTLSHEPLEIASVFLGSVSFEVESKPWLAEANNRIDELSKLQDGWQDAGVAPLQIAIDNAKEIAFKLARSRAPVDSPAIAALSDGGVAVAIRDGERFADFECYNDGETLVSLMLTDGSEFEEIYEIRPWQFQNYIIKVLGFLKVGVLS